MRNGETKRGKEMIEGGRERIDTVYLKNG